MKKFISLLVSLMIFTALAACSSNKAHSEKPTSEAAQNNKMTTENSTSEESNTMITNGNKQTTNPDLPTRVLKNGTKINLHFGNTVIPGILNDSKAAQVLISRLPYTVKVSRYDFDICGVMKEPLPYEKDEVTTGWLNGDIDFTTQGDYFTILFDNEEKSGGGFVNLGVIDCELPTISKLEGSFDMLIELAK